MARSGRLSARRSPRARDAGRTFPRCTEEPRQAGGMCRGGPGPTASRGRKHTARWWGGSEAAEKDTEIALLQGLPHPASALLPSPGGNAAGGFGFAPRVGDRRLLTAHLPPSTSARGAAREKAGRSGALLAFRRLQNCWCRSLGGAPDWSCRSLGGAPDCWRRSVRGAPN